MTDTRTFMEDFDADLDGTCILSMLSDVAAAAICDHEGIPYDADDPTDRYVDELDRGGAVIEALVNRGLLRREWFTYVAPEGGRPSIGVVE